MNDIIMPAHNYYLYVRLKITTRKCRRQPFRKSDLLVLLPDARAQFNYKKRKMATEIYTITCQLKYRFILQADKVIAFFVRIIAQSNFN